MRKPRSDAWHAGLTVEQLDRAFAWAGGSGYVEAIKLIKAEFGRSPSLAAISTWYQSWPLQRAFLTAGSVAETVKSAVRDLPQLNLDPAQMDALGQVVFQTEAMRQMNLDAFADLKRLQQKDRELQLVERRVVLLEKKAALADQAAAVVGSQLDPAERERRLKEIFGLQ